MTYIFDDVDEDRVSLPLWVYSGNSADGWELLKWLVLLVLTCWISTGNRAERLAEWLNDTFGSVTYVQPTTVPMTEPGRIRQHGPHCRCDYCLNKTFLGG